MDIYLYGPPGPDQQETKAVLQLRGYQVVTATDLRDPDFGYNNGITPSPQRVRNLQLMHMQHAHAVVLDHTVNADMAAPAIAVCRFGGMRCVKLEDLPAQVPSSLREEEILDALDLVKPLPPSPAKRLRGWAANMLAAAHRVQERFNQRYAWFLTNGRKQHRLQRPATVSTLSTQHQAQ